MSGDFVQTKTITVTVQENGWVRNKEGILIAKLVSGIDFNSPAVSDTPIKLSPWTIYDGYCAFRYIIGTDPEVIANRVAFIEKTPRVRIRPWNSRDEDAHDHLNWESGPKGSGCSGDFDPKQEGAYGFDQSSRDWCDKKLRHMGYQLTDTV